MANTGLCNDLSPSKKTEPLMISFSLQTDKTHPWPFQGFHSFTRWTLMIKTMYNGVPSATTGMYKIYFLKHPKNAKSESENAKSEH